MAIYDPLVDLFLGGFDPAKPMPTPTSPTVPAKEKKTFDYWSKLVDDLLAKGLKTAEIISAMKGQGYGGNTNFGNDVELQQFLAQQAQEEKRIENQKYIAMGLGAAALIGLIIYATKK